jgi:seryl-tRNA synthetase
MLDKLKEYKEVVTIIVFFLGGFFWLESQFPKRSDLATLNCLLEKYMTITQLQIRNQELEQEIVRIKDQIGNGGSPQLSPAMTIQLDEIKEDLKNRQSDRRDVIQEMDQIRVDLQMQVCGKV